VLAASRTGFGGKRKLLSATRKLLHSIPSMLLLEDDTTLDTADSSSTADSWDSDNLFSEAAGRALLDMTPSQHAAKTCSTNAHPQQQCPAGWDKVTKQFVSSTPATSPAVVAASVAGRASGSKGRKAPRRIPGTVSSLGRDTRRRARSSVAAMATAATAAAASADTAASTVAYCAGAALYRPLTVDYSIAKPFDAEVDEETGDWMFHAALTFSAAEGADVYAAHDGTVTATGTDPTLGDFAVGSELASNPALSCSAQPARPLTDLDLAALVHTARPTCAHAVCLSNVLHENLKPVVCHTVC
jgi:murein DD-endopeptidase MepM/ murein hydrolase activator NlpD